MSSGWIKFFKNNSFEKGCDEDILKGKASWSKGKLKDISRVHLYNKLIVSVLEIPNTEWHQFDRYAVSLQLGENKPIRTHQIVQALIKKSFYNRYIAHINNLGCHVWAFANKNSLNKKITDIRRIERDDIDKWITMILPTVGAPFIKITEKGKIT